MPLRLKQIQVILMKQLVTMKNKLIILFLSILWQFPLMGQRTEPERFDNVMYIQTDSAASWNMEVFGNHLTAYGYVLENVNEKFRTLTTAEKTTSGGYKHKLSIVFKDNQIIIRATCNLLLLGSTVGNYQQTWVDWEYRTSKGNIFYKHFQAFYPVVTAFGEPVYFDHK
jgi:hypothetical protein